MIERRSKNVIAWRGAEQAASENTDSSSDEVSQHLEEVRRMVGKYYEEESMLDYWIGKLRKLAADAPSLHCSSEDIVEAMQSPRASSGAVPGGRIPISTDPEKGSNMTLFAVKAPHGSVVQVPNRPKPAPGGQRANRRLFISSDPKLALSLENEAPPPKKRGRPRTKDIEREAKRAKKQLNIYMLPTDVDEDGKLHSKGVRELPENPLVGNGTHNLGAMFGSNEEDGFIWDFTPALTRDEGVSNFFPMYERPDEKDDE